MKFENFFQGVHNSTFTASITLFRFNHLISLKLVIKEIFICAVGFEFITTPSTLFLQREEVHLSQKLIRFKFKFKKIQMHIPSGQTFPHKTSLALEIVAPSNVSKITPLRYQLKYLTIYEDSFRVYFDGRIEKICVFHHVCLVGRIENVCVFFHFVEKKKNEKMEKVVYISLLLCPYYIV
jgi:hypothetical protein